MRLHKYDSPKEYVEVQTEWNRRKIGMVWVRRDTIEIIAEYIRKSLTAPKFGICHGTRRGVEQVWFRDLLDIEVIGTEISDTAFKFPYTIQWDFHDVKDEWVGSVDFVYSNSLDHSHSPKECVAGWMRCLRPGGLCFIEWTERDHGDGHVNALDCFGASVAEMRDFLPLVHDEIVIGKEHSVFVLRREHGQTDCSIDS